MANKDNRTISGTRRKVIAIVLVSGGAMIRAKEWNGLLKGGVRVGEENRGIQN